MISTIQAGRTLLVEATDPRLIEDDLNSALDAAHLHAMKEARHGILVTRHGHTTFTVAISARVPYGQTVEEDGSAWSPWKAHNSETHAG